MSPRLRTCLATLAAALAASAAPVLAASGIAGRCESLPGGFWEPVMGRARLVPPALARPPKGVPFRDPSFGTCIVRLTEHDREAPRGFARNDYSRREPFNANNTLALVTDSQGSWQLYDTVTLQSLGAVAGVGGDAEPQWHPTDPDVFYYIPNNGLGMKLYEYHVAARSSRLVADFGPRLRALWPDAATAWTRSEGSPSADLRYWAFQVDDSQWRGVGLFTYDLKTDTILATYDLQRNGKSRPDHLSMSPSGRYVVVSWDEGPFAFDRDFSNPRRIARRGEHSDIALDPAGDDVYVSVDYDAHGGPVYMVNLRTGKRTDLFPTYLDSTATAIHFSGKAYAKPGWVVVSTYGDYRKGGQVQASIGPDFQWLHRRVFAVELHEDPKIVGLAFHHGIAAKYFTEPHAATDRKLTRVLFNSNWGTGSETDVDAYMVVIPDTFPNHRR